MEKGKGNDQRGPVSPVPSPEGNPLPQILLRHQEILRQTYPSMDMSEEFAEDVIEKVGPEKAGDIFTKVEDGDSPTESGSDALSKQLNSLVEKAQEVVEANELHSQSMGRTSGSRTPSSEPRGDLDKIIESVSAAESKDSAHKAKMVPTELAEDMQPAAVAKDNAQLTTRSAPEAKVKETTKEE